MAVNKAYTPQFVRLNGFFRGTYLRGFPRENFQWIGIIAARIAMLALWTYSRDSTSVCWSPEYS